MILVYYLTFSIINASFLRKYLKVAQRINDVNWQLLVLIDIIVAFFLFGPFYILGWVTELRGDGQTVSSYSYRNAIKGKSWAIISVRIIDKVFNMLTGQQEHCKKAYEDWTNPNG